MKIITSHSLLAARQLLPALCFILNCSSGWAQKKFYVKTDGIAGLTGTSWNWASNDLQDIIDNKAVAGDTVFVAVGTYHGGFTMKEGVIVKGGYTANKDNPTERYNIMETDDPAQQSILDGGEIQRVLTQVIPFSIPTTWNGFVIQNGSPSAEFKKGSIIYSNNTGSKITGILYKYDPETKQGMIIGKEEINKQWGTYGKEIPELPSTTDRETAGDDVSGQAHSESILADLGNQSIDFEQENYTLNGNYAAYWCDTLTVGGYSDWYLPSTGELQEVYEADISVLMKNLGKNLIYPYWTSSHVGNTLAWTYCFGNGYFHPALKYVKYSVSAIHPFIAPERPDSIYSAGGGAFLCANGILENCVVKNNVSPSRGGGVYAGIGSQLINCIVEGNEAPEGKEIYYEKGAGITSPDADSGIRIYPNPVKTGGILTIDWRQEYSTGYRLINVAGGNTLMKGKLTTGNNSIQVTVPKGIYILWLQSEKSGYKSKIIIN
jgi:hypothetical protein